MRTALLLLAVVIAGCAPASQAVREEEGEPIACHTDLDCPLGGQCIRPRGELNGLCGKVVDANATPTTGIRREADPCHNDFDCPPMFRCQLTTSLVGVCVKG